MLGPSLQGLHSVANELAEAHSYSPKTGTGELALRDQYRNMKEIILPVMHIVDTAKEAMRELGIEPIDIPIRGGTDGSRLTEMGVPCPNLFTGMQNIHGPLEWISVQDMGRATNLCLTIAQSAARPAG